MGPDETAGFAEDISAVDQGTITGDRCGDFLIKSVPMAQPEQYVRPRASVRRSPGTGLPVVLRLPPLPAFMA